MSKQTYEALEEAIRAHIVDTAEQDGTMLIDWVIGYASMHPDSSLPDGRCFHNEYLVAPMAPPHASVGLFVMASAKLEEDLANDD